MTLAAEKSAPVKIMGILNCTPDSFSDGGCMSVEDLVKKALCMVDDGADIIDIGGESTRPGAKSVSASEEMARFLPVLRGLRKRSDIPVSIDTSKARVAASALAAGADIINDVTALRGDSAMAEVAASYKAPVVIMHMQGNPRNMQLAPEYKDVVAEVSSFFEERIEFARTSGISEVILDPGFGFGKTYAHNVELFNSLPRLRIGDSKLLVGVSRKSMIGQALGLPVEQRMEASLALAVLAAEKGAGIVRVHDVRETHRALRMREALLVK